MTTSNAPDVMWERLSEFVATKMGLHFPQARWPDLKRAAEGMAKEFDLPNSEACAEWLLSEPLTKAQLQTLASHLTIGETYFFRDRRIFEAVADTALPELIRLRRGRDRRLRLWSAGCCTGEEAYSLAILLHQLIPDLAEWNVGILATDINGRFLQKAAAGIYGKWSFRDSPPGFTDRYFRSLGNGSYEVAPEIKKLVTFAQLNLVEDFYPTLATDTNAMDLIFCRNVLMYFTPGQATETVRKLRRALVEGGWLAVSPCEASQTLFSQFKPVNFPGAVLYRKSNDVVLVAPPLWDTAAAPETAAPSSLADGGALYQEGRYQEAAETVRNSIETESAPIAEAFSLMARTLANQGDLAGALDWCDRWIAAEKLDASGHYLRAVVLQELGKHEQARQSLQRAVYLSPDMVLAHFALGNLARAVGKNTEAVKHFNNALHFLKSLQPDEVLPESDGMTAGRLNEIISSITALEITLGKGE
jgi:chemotaxis protein methyltransferase CheR